MNQHLAHDSQAALVSCPVNAMCLAPDDDQQRLVCVAEETPIAFRYDSFSHAVMMATPADPEDFAMGFSRSEGIIEASADLQKVSIRWEDEGVVIDISLSGTSLHRYLANRRVRQLNGRTSCGLCGVEDLKDVRRPAPRVRAAKLPTIERRVEGLRVVAYDIPEGCIAGYYPECNPLLPLWHHAEKSKVPAAKSIPVRVHASTSS
jgi:hypothetical protein